MRTPLLISAPFGSETPHHQLLLTSARFASSYETIAVGELVYYVTGHYTVERPESSFPPAWVPAHRWPAEVLCAVSVDGMAHLRVYSHSGSFEVQAYYGRD